MSTNRTSESLGKSIEIRQSNRPIKIAFIVPVEESEIAQWILDAIFAESYTRWGGARSLIVPYSNQIIDVRYKEWLKTLDPDFIYSYVDLTENQIIEMNELTLPIALIRHRDGNYDRWRDLIPDWSNWFVPVSSISTITSPHSNYSAWSKSATPIQPYITQFDDNPSNRFLADNFGVRFFLDRFTTDHTDIYETITYCSDTVPANTVINSHRTGSINDLVNKLADRSVKTIAKLSALFTQGIPRPYDHTWANSFHIVIGDSILDRINFWNIRHFKNSLSSTEDISSLIIPEQMIEDGEFCKSIGLYLNNTNYLGQNNSPPQVQISSYSLPSEVCSNFVENLNKNNSTWNRVYLANNLSAIAVPDNRSFKAMQFIAGASAPSFKAYESKITFYASEPEHFQYIPHNFLFAKSGQWAIDLVIERHNGKSGYVNIQNNWKLPRYLEVVRGFTNQLGKINLLGNLTLIPSNPNRLNVRPKSNSLKVDLRFPEDETIFSLLLTGIGVPLYSDYRTNLNKDKYLYIELSDKGQYHRGVVSKFEDLTEAAEILTNKFWRELIRANKTNSKPTLKTNKEVIYPTYCIDNLNNPINQLGEDALEIQQALRFKDITTTKRYLKNNLKDVVQKLVHSEVILQVHIWKCSYCGSQNKRSLDTLKLQNNCDVCKSTYETPIEFEWRYSISNFVIDSLASHSGLTVLWALSYLCTNYHSQGFLYLPEVNLFKSDKKNDYKEIDIVAIANGKFYAGEVKYSVTDFINDTDEITSFIEKMNVIRPNIALLAFEIYKHENETNQIEEIELTLQTTLADIKQKLPVSIQLEVIVAESFNEFKKFPHQIGPWGERTYNFFDSLPDYYQ